MFGVQFIGIPVFILGSTQEMVWGITIMQADVHDIYEERVDFEKNTYEFKGEQLPLTQRKEIISVKGQAPYELKVYETHHGPLLGNMSQFGIGIST